jgi:hypothetical protein
LIRLYMEVGGREGFDRPLEMEVGGGNFTRDFELFRLAIRSRA